MNNRLRSFRLGHNTSILSDRSNSISLASSFAFDSVTLRTISVRVFGCLTREKLWVNKPSVIFFRLNTGECDIGDEETRSRGQSLWLRRRGYEISSLMAHSAFNGRGWCVANRFELGRVGRRWRRISLGSIFGFTTASRLLTFTWRRIWSGKSWGNSLRRVRWKIIIVRHLYESSDLYDDFFTFLRFLLTKIMRFDCCERLCVG
jgi:hypothetical protein